MARELGLSNQMLNGAAIAGATITLTSHTSAETGKLHPTGVLLNTGWADSLFERKVK